MRPPAVEDTFHAEVIKAVMALRQYVGVSLERIKRLTQLSVTELEVESLRNEVLLLSAEKTRKPHIFLGILNPVRLPFRHPAKVTRSPFAS